MVRQIESTGDIPSNYESRQFKDETPEVTVSMPIEMIRSDDNSFSADSK